MRVGVRVGVRVIKLTVRLRKNSSEVDAIVGITIICSYFTPRLPVLSIGLLRCVSTHELTQLL